MLRSLIAAAVAAVFLVPVSAEAQVLNALVVTTCGTQTLTAGLGYPITMDLTGALCSSGGGGGGGGAVTIADGADVALGAKADAAYAGSGAATLIAISKGIYASVNGPIPAGTAKIGQVAIDQTTPGTTNLVQLAASTSQIGLISGSNVGGYDASPATTPTVQNAAYSSGNCMGGFQTVSLARTSGGSGIINKFSIVSTGGSTVAMQVYVFDTNPSGSTCTDKSTFTIVAADQSKLLTTFSVTPAAPTGASWTEAEVSNLGIPFLTSGNSNVYVAIVAGATVTPASTTDLKFRVGAAQD